MKPHNKKTVRYTAIIALIFALLLTAGAFITACSSTNDNADSDPTPAPILLRTPDTAITIEPAESDEN